MQRASHLRFGGNSELVRQRLSIDDHAEVKDFTDSTHFFQAMIVECLHTLSGFGDLTQIYQSS